jgi:glycosyltransferase involved in cell wall biosynthesis
MNVTLSVLIPSVPERMDHLKRIVDELSRQSEHKAVEILVLLDNKKRTVGSKRNTLIEQAQGAYIVFVDDDDRVEPNYVDFLCASIEAMPEVDCVVFDVEVNYNGYFSKICKYGKEYNYGEDARYYYRKPNHLMCYARRIAVKHPFKDIGYGEDDEWAARVSEDIVHQARLPATLYHYDYVPKPMDWYSSK